MAELDRPFWSRDSTREAIRTLADADELTVIVGAGASAEAGMPTWRGLLQQMLAKVSASVLPDLELPEGTDRDEFDRWFGQVSLETDGVLGAGALVKACLGDEAFELALIDELYREVGAEPLPGPTATAITKLWDKWDSKLHIATTNYDRSLEDAFAWELEEGSVESLVDGGPKQSKVAVRHLHGIRTPQVQRGELVFTEADYHLMQHEAAWQETWFRERLETSTCLFVGTSMTDPNLLRYVYRTQSRRPHVAVLVRQADEAFNPRIARALHEARVGTSDRRWSSAGIQALHADYFVQSAQLLHELACAREPGGNYVDYRERVAEWSRRCRDGGLLDTSDARRFGQRQEDLHALLREWLQTVRSTLADLENPLADDETIGIHLWVRHPEQRTLVLWAGSDRSWRDPRTLRPVPIERPTHWVSIEGFCSGTPIEYATDDTALTRWNFVRAVPLFISSHETWQRLPVGVLTIASNLPQGQSRLAAAPPLVWDYLESFLTPPAVAYLTPEE